MTKANLLSLEIVLTDGSTFYTLAYDTPLECRAAIERGDVLTVFWHRSDGTRFEEEMWFAPDVLRRIATNRS